jgi:hypothetical protein
MPRNKVIYFIAATAVGIIAGASNLLAAQSVDDRFGSARKIDTQHFTVYFAPSIDLPELAQSFNIRASDDVLTGRSSGAGLEGMIDTLFSLACDILDMQLYSYHGTIKICPDQAKLDEIYNTLFNKSLQSRKPFYVYDLDTIYISADSFTREILGHEMGHAIISHYFVVLPSVKIQEVLAAYVEYQLRKHP